MSCWSDLPEDLWRLILAHFPLPERLGNCSRVSKKLCRAAAAATEELDLLHSNQQRLQGVVQWLQHMGRHVTQLRFKIFDALPELPCQQLRQLTMRRGTVQLGPSSNHPGVLHSCSGLTGLILQTCEIQTCEVDDGPSSLSALSAVPALQHLELLTCYHVQHKLPSSILQVLTQLTPLKLDGFVNVSGDSLQHLSALQHLQVLDLHTWCSSVLLSPDSTPGLARLTALHTVKLSGATLDPAVLQHHTQLRHLELCASVLLGTTPAASLLSAIGQQLQLQQLQLRNVRCEWLTATAAYTALTASSRLQVLTLRLAGLPAGIWQAVFRPQQQLPHLQSLVIGTWPQADAATRLSSTDVSSVVACCPLLQHLDIQLQPDAQLAALSQLTALTALTTNRPGN